MFIKIDDTLINVDDIVKVKLEHEPYKFTFYSQCASEILEYTCKDKDEFVWIYDQFIYTESPSKAIDRLSDALEQVLIDLEDISSMIADVKTTHNKIFRLC